MITASASAVASKPGLRPDPPVNATPPKDDAAPTRSKGRARRHGPVSEGVADLVKTAQDVFARATNKGAGSGPAQVRIAPGLLERVRDRIDGVKLDRPIRVEMPQPRDFQTGPARIDDHQLPTELRDRLWSPLGE